MTRGTRQGSQVSGPGPSTQAMRDAEAIGDGPIDEAGRAAMKDEYRRLRAQAMHNNENIESVTIDDLHQAIRDGNAIFKHVKNAPEAALDALVMKLNSDTAQKLGKAARSEANSFNIDDFMEPLRSMLGLNFLEAEDVDMDEDGHIPRVRHGRIGDWRKVGWLVAKRSRRVSGLEFMLGPLATQHKKRIINRRARVQQTAAREVRPIEIEQEDMQKNENETVKNVALLERLLEAAMNDPTLDANTEFGIPFFQWLINPGDFGQSVENMFYTSFLVREGKASVGFDDDGEMRILACEPPTDEDHEGGLTRRQVVMELQMETWRQAIKDYNITKSYIPNRQNIQTSQPQGTGWY